MSWPPHIWDQIKNITADELIAALEHDGWHLRKGKGSRRVFRNHYHRRKTFSPKMLQTLLKDIGWNEADLRRLGLIR
jgi:predicted RNA binding protein YcfA (HicA-like mRNA interferase family)